MLNSFHLNPRRTRLVLYALLGLLFSSFILHPSSFVSADEETLTLLPGQQHIYRFEYKGDRTEIIVVVEAPEGVELGVYEPDATEPVGRGARRDNEMIWVGKFRAPGVYRAIVENKTPGPVLYSLAILGESVSGVGRIVEDTATSLTDVSKQGGRQTLHVKLPTGARRLQSPVMPAQCTPANALPQIINTSIKLCPNEIYPPLHLVGNDIGLFGDGARSAVINGGGRQFLVVMEGTGNWIDGVVIQSAPDAADAGAFLCQYDECIFPTQPEPTKIQGGLNYGGGILLLGANNVVHDVTVRGGTIGIASVDGYNNVLVENNLSDLNGWGNFNIRSNNSVFVGNTFNRDDHPCTTPDGRKFENGCETAGWVCLQCANNLVVNNHCEASGNCYYMSGERGLASNNNRFIGNYCAAAPNNCFEFTFSKGNVLQDNIATAHPQTGAACKYPFWIGGSTVYFGKNAWSCSISPEISIAHAIASTNTPTIALALGTNAPTYGTAATPFPQPTRLASASASPTPPAAPQFAKCNRRYRLPLLFDWNKLTAWVQCMLTPRLKY
ncbi:MAG: right-handed parallel beta-helix repeat-containing protein [Chloroflexi bacterium]|nr:right-handed parallel beta-helix repeat-containing protein [Chloroflexota bacterium]